MKKFKFYKENHLDKGYELTIDQIKERYDKYLRAKDEWWILHQGHQTIAYFIADKDGLNSTTDPGEQLLLVELLKGVRHELIAYK